MTRIVCISDTHNQHDDVKLPDGDILIHAGDMTVDGDERSVANFSRWFLQQPHRYKVCIAGNHDFLFQRNPSLARCFFPFNDNDVIYLENSSTVIVDLGLKIWGTPWTPYFHNWAYNANRDEDNHQHVPNLRKIYEKIPDDTHIIVCHSPAYGILDRVKNIAHGRDPHQGSKEMLDQIERCKDLKLYVCGHIHESYGTQLEGNVLHVNASTCNLKYQPKNPPIVIDL